MKIKPSNKIVATLLFTLCAVAGVFYPILPRILNYPPDSIDNVFQKGIDSGILYTEQYLIIMLMCFIVGWTSIKLITKELDKIYKEKITQINNYEKIAKIFSIPYKIYLIHVLIPAFVILSLFFLVESSLNFGSVKIALVIVTMESCSALVVFIYCKKLISKIFEKLHIEEQYIKKFTSMKSRIFIILLPIILMALIFASMVGYSRIVEEKGEYMNYYYDKILEEKFFDDNYSQNKIKDIFGEIEKKQVDDTFFIIFADKSYTKWGNLELSDFFIKYTLELSSNHNNRTYETYGIDEQGSVKRIVIDGKEAYVGIKYKVIMDGTIIYFILAIILLFIINSGVLYYIAKSLADDTRKVSDALNFIVKNPNESKRKYLPITSNDEIAQLVIAFNKIQDLTDEYINMLEDNQYIMQRQAQFAILGEFAGGLAHDLNSPLSAVQLDVSTLQKYMKSDKIQADENVREVILEMLMNIDSSLNKMAGTIAGVRNQIRATGDSEKETFKVKEVIEGIEILFGSILRKSNCRIQNIVGDDAIIYGEKNKLDRVLGNVIKNSIDAYVENNLRGTVTVFSKIIDNMCIIGIEDQAGGIPDDVAKTMFKEMKTTKEENGTGFGLYYSNTIIESSFNGKMRFETENGKGTIFYIEIPIIKEEK